MYSKKILYKILWSTIEDYVGLWEILWEIHTILPTYSENHNKSIAKESLLFFLKEELVKLYIEKWGSNKFEEISLDQATKFLNQDNFWIAPNVNEICVKVGSTKKGNRFYTKNLL